MESKLTSLSVRILECLDISKYLDGLSDIEKESLKKTQLKCKKMLLTSLESIGHSMLIVDKDIRNNMIKNFINSNSILMKNAIIINSFELESYRLLNSIWDNVIQSIDTLLIDTFLS